MDMREIGIVKSPMKDAVDEGWGNVICEIHLDGALAPGLEGLEQFSHVIVLFHMHQFVFDPEVDLMRRPRGRSDMPLVGAFAQRAKHRPNPIGVTAARLLRVSANILTVQGLDAIDGTPVLDLKPYLPAWDCRPDASVPRWIEELMEGYF
jgi:tRNA-Thr(GGU) m(6)t(6)A37 methyltransferase TsaA